MWKGQGPGKKNLENIGLDSFENKDKKPTTLGLAHEVDQKLTGKKIERLN